MFYLLYYWQFSYFEEKVMTEVEMLEKLDRGLVICGQCSLEDRAGRVHRVKAEHWKSHWARDARQDRVDRFHRRLKELFGGRKILPKKEILDLKAAIRREYPRQAPKILPRFGQILWDLRILGERIFRRTSKPKRVFTALQRVKASIGR